MQKFIMPLLFGLLGAGCIVFAQSDPHSLYYMDFNGSNKLFLGIGIVVFTIGVISLGTNLKDSGAGTSADALLEILMLPFRLFIIILRGL